MKQEAKVIISSGILPSPERHEVEIAWILAKHYTCVVEFLKPIDGYRMKTADVVMNGNLWEIKSPQGNSKLNTIKEQFKKGTKQSKFIVIDGRRTKLSDVFIQKQIVFEMRNRPRTKKTIYINKSKEVIEI